MKSFKIYFILMMILILSIDGKEIYKIGLGGSVPFLINENNPKGVIIDIWQEMKYILIRENPNLIFEEIYYNNIKNFLDDLNQQKIDFACGSISVTTERFDQFEFSYPIYEARLGIVSPVSQFQILNFIKIFNKNVLFVPFIFFLLLVLIGTILWKYEKEKNPDFQKEPIKSIGNGIWLAIVTFTTVVYGDLAPKTLKGRILLSLWMILAMVFASSLTASIASALTLLQLTSPKVESVNDLYNKRVLTIKGSSSEVFIKNYTNRLFYKNQLKEALEELDQKPHLYDAFVYDYPILKYNIKINQYSNLKLIPVPEFSEYYACAFKKSNYNKFLPKINKSILILKENKTITKIYKKWNIE
ncbi:MAG: hypothetical protein KatS3mg129_1432 [Leptospiraceae bacterium]|nr:MAG: hypothetical protein KatS3mg129_1432 [Leptospiraceae bacterium]